MSSKGVWLFAVSICGDDGVWRQELIRRLSQTLETYVPDGSLSHVMAAWMDGRDCTPEGMRSWLGFGARVGTEMATLALFDLVRVDAPTDGPPTGPVH